MRLLLNIARKDAVVIARDKAAVLVMLAMPLALIFILGSALGGIESSSTINIDVAVVNEDAGSAGAQFVTGFTENEQLAEVFNIEVRDDAAAVRADVENGNIAAALIIPEDLTAKIAAGEPVALEVLQDPGSQIAAGIWAGVVRAGAAQASASIIVGRVVEEAASGAAGVGGQVGPPHGDATGGAQTPEIGFSAVTVREVEAKTEKRVSMISYYAAGMTGMFLLFGSMFGAFAFVKERREQTFARMLSTPATRTAIVGGKSLGILMIGVGQVVVLFAGTRLMFGVDWGEQWWAGLLLGLAESVAAAGLAMTLSVLGKTERSIGGIGPAIIILFAATGGSMMPVEVLPAWLKPLQAISPTYWTVGGFLDVMRGAGLADVIGPIGAILGIAFALFAFGIWRLRYE